MGNIKIILENPEIGATYYPILIIGFPITCIMKIITISFK